MACCILSCPRCGGRAGSTLVKTPSAHSVNHCHLARDDFELFDDSFGATGVGHVYHVLNRSIGKTRKFAKVSDHEAFESVIVEAHERHPIRILSYCVLSNHWHFVVWPEKDGQLTDFFRWLAHTHAMRWRVSHRTVGHGPLYQGRLKSFPVQRDKHFLTLLRYIERSPLSAGLVENAQQWRWGSLWSRVHGDKAIKAVLSPWPVKRASKLDGSRQCPFDREGIGPSAGER